jgi:hypothetical protein
MASGECQFSGTVSGVTKCLLTAGSVTGSAWTDVPMRATAKVDIRSMVGF